MDIKKGVFMIENSIVYRTYKKAGYFRLAKALGSEIWDPDGKRYVDFTSGWNVNNLGFNHLEIAAAMHEQLDENASTLLWGSNQIQEKYAAALTDALPDPLNACCKENGGTDANEVAIKIARVHTRRRKILGFNDMYHGQLFASLAVGGVQDSKKHLLPLVGDIDVLEFPHKHISAEKYAAFLTDLENRLKREDVAAILTETGVVTGWGSTLLPYPGLLTDLRRLTTKYGTMLIVDEVGTGFSRTGKLFAIEHENVVPDMLVLAKAIANGAAGLSTVVGNDKIFREAFDEAWLISTFGWMPIACAAALKTLEIHQRDNTADMAARKGRHIIDKLNPYVGDKLIEVDGLGMEIGLRFKDDATATAVQQSCFDNGLQLVVGGLNNIQMMPPLNIPDEMLDEGLDILINQIK
ncbi:aspartate aminotransferase family protein [Candidatus Saccharibacteria bacterium]|nr:aspartate aminotransferase family protein [Candidatus Saccharibacteria bacterium]